MGLMTGWVVANCKNRFLANRSRNARPFRLTCHPGGPASAWMENSSEKKLCCDDELGVVLSVVEVVGMFDVDGDVFQILGLYEGSPAETGLLREEEEGS